MRNYYNEREIETKIQDLEIALKDSSLYKNTVTDEDFKKYIKRTKASLKRLKNKLAELEARM